MKLSPFQIFVITFLSLLSLSAKAGGDYEHENPEGASFYPAIIRINSEKPGQVLDSLRNEGVIIFRQRKDMILCCVPEHSEASATRRITRRFEKPTLEISKGRSIVPAMDVAREWFDASGIHKGISPLPVPYTGKGVVTGICDVGFDPLHIAFKDAQGNTRIRRIVQYRESMGERIEMSSEEEYAQWETDDADRWHATHVAGIMAGGYGKYSGMAPESDIVITTSELSDVGLLCGAEDILEYAKSVGKPAVINMSMANYTGPHDGSTLFSQYLDLIGEEAVVVLSSGNSGNLAYTLPVTFTEEKPSVSLGIYSSDWIQFNPRGYVDVWSSTDSPVSIRIGFRDIDTGKIVSYLPRESLFDGEIVTVTSDSEYRPVSERERVFTDPVFSDIYTGSFSLYGEIDETNGRHNMLLAMDAHTDIVSSKGAWARYVPVIEVSGAPGSEADIYADGNRTVFRALPGEPTPGSMLSFSDLATGRNVISVGMYVNRDTFPHVDGGVMNGSDDAGTVSKYSSYATLRDRRVMPITVAPGDGVISAISNRYLTAHPEDRETLNEETVENGELYGWISCRGTSMSAPYVAGAIACWLEALPYLTTAKIIEYLDNSNRKDCPEPENPRHGRGWFDPFKGLCLALKDNVETSFPEAEADQIRFTYSGRELTVFNPGAPAIIDVYTIAGQKIHSFTCGTGVEKASLTSLPAGIYIVTVAGSRLNMKISVTPSN